MKIEKSILKFLTSDLRNGREPLSVIFQTFSVIYLIIQHTDNSLLPFHESFYIPDLILLLSLLHFTVTSTTNISTATIASVVPK